MSLQTSLILGLKMTRFSHLLLHSICCDVRSHSTSGKCHCTLTKEWEWEKQIMFQYFNNSFDPVDLLKGSRGLLAHGGLEKLWSAWIWSFSIYWDFFYSLAYGLSWRMSSALRKRMRTLHLLDAAFCKCQWSQSGL